MEYDYKKEKQISIRFTFFNCIALLFPKSAIILPK